MEYYCEAIRITIYNFYMPGKSKFLKSQVRVALNLLNTTKFSTRFYFGILMGWWDESLKKLLVEQEINQ